VVTAGLGRSLPASFTGSLSCCWPLSLPASVTASLGCCRPQSLPASIAASLSGCWLQLQLASVAASLGCCQSWSLSAVDAADFKCCRPCKLQSMPAPADAGLHCSWHPSMLASLAASFGSCRSKPLPALVWLALVVASLDCCQPWLLPTPAVADLGSCQHWFNQP